MVPLSMTLSQGFKVTTFLKSNIGKTARLKNKVTIAQEEMKKRSERRKHCALAVVRRNQKFSPHHRHLSRGCRMAKI